MYIRNTLCDAKNHISEKWIENERKCRYLLINPSLLHYFTGQILMLHWTEITSRGEVDLLPANISGRSGVGGDKQPGGVILHLFSSLYAENSRLPPIRTEPRKTPFFFFCFPKQFNNVRSAMNFQFSKPLHHTRYSDLSTSEWSVNRDQLLCGARSRLAYIFTCFILNRNVF
jgi:hypothetical protein